MPLRITFSEKLIAGYTLSVDNVVSAAWLAGHLAEVIVLDTRWRLTGPASGRDAYAAGHIPGAFFVDLDRELAELPAPDKPGRHPLPSATTFAEMLARVGYRRGARVVAYDDMGGAIAARLWFLMGYFGLGGAAVLDGGIGAWQAAGGALVQEEPEVAPTDRLALTARPALIVDAARVDALRGDPRALVIDARGADRYRGDDEPIDPRPGHIPGAVNAPFAENLEGGRFKSREALRERFTALGALGREPVVVYCGSGVTACHDILALEIAGHESLLYEGSWSDWAADPARPAAVGEDP